MKKANKTTSVPNRRQFLAGLGAGCAAMTQVSALSTLVNLSLTKSAAAAIDVTGYKALVCVFLFGGIDSHNVLLPREPGEYADYVTARSALALPDDGTIHDIVNPLESNRAFGLHPALGDLADLYNSGNLAFVANVGSLIEPVDIANYYGGARLPLGLYSHSDQQRHWQTSTPQSRTEITGWLGRMADVLNDLTNTNEAISMNIAIDRLNILQTGDQTIPYVVDDNNGAQVLSGYGGTNTLDRILTQTTDSFLANSYSDLLKDTHRKFRAGAIDAAESYNAATAGITFSQSIEDAFSASSLGRQLRQVAKAIGAHGALGQDRQVFFASGGGWDNHANLLAAHAGLLPQVNSALKAFYDALVELGVQDDVVTYTASDFARTLNANSNNGSDHAWGGNHIVMGGSVNGGNVFGNYPVSLAPGNSLDVGRGRMIPTTSVDLYTAEMARWFGIDNDSVLETIIPNIRNFYSSSETNAPMGFLADAIS